LVIRSVCLGRDPSARVAHKALGPSDGQIIPFASSKADRGNDPRRSLQERYGNPDGTNANYVAKVAASAKRLVRERFLLELPGIVEDVETYTAPAASVIIPANP